MSSDLRGMSPEKKTAAAVDEAAKTIWDYMRLNQPIEKAEVILVFGCSDEYVARHGARLWLDGYGDWLVASGGVVHGYEAWAGLSEAERFAQIAQQAGVPAEKILLEKQATNTGENAVFSHRLLKSRGLEPRSLLAIHKPYMERRVLATLQKQWSDSEASIQVTSHPFSCGDYLLAHEFLSRERILNSMAADLRKIREYSKLGYQTRQEIPQEVWQAYECLTARGYG